MSLRLLHADSSGCVAEVTVTAPTGAAVMIKFAPAVLTTALLPEPSLSKIFPREILTVARPMALALNFMIPSTPSLPLNPGFGNPPPKYALDAPLLGEAGAGKIKVEPWDTLKSSRVSEVKVIFDSAVLTVAPVVSASTLTVNSSP